jgi:hypothetical protein
VLLLYSAAPCPREHVLVALGRGRIIRRLGALPLVEALPELAQLRSRGALLTPGLVAASGEEAGDRDVFVEFVRM